MDTNIVIKKGLSKMMLICIKQHLSNIWSWIHEKVKLHLGRVKKKKIYKGYKASNFLIIYNQSTFQILLSIINDTIGIHREGRLDLGGFTHMSVGKKTCI